jgi:NAD(P)-dependent dehydrogenase (short-subunit alcohol dehydrogenase family)
MRSIPGHTCQLLRFLVIIKQALEGLRSSQLTQDCPISVMSQSKGVALVTGSAQGIGRAIAIRLARDGFDVALNDLPAKSAVLEDLAAEIQRGGETEGAYHPRTCIVACDVSKEDEVKRMIDTTVHLLGSLDVVSCDAD